MVEMWVLERRAPVAVGGGGIGWEANSWFVRLGGGGDFVGFSHESEHDLGVMVRDFVENGSCGADSWYSSDSDSGSSDLNYLSNKISLYKHSLDQYESDLLLVVHSLILSINEANHLLGNAESCSISCIRFSLVKLLQSSGYDASICATKWQGCSKIPGGEHEFIDVIYHQDGKSTERCIIDIDFRSHFEIARAVKTYDALLNSLPPVYVGSMTKLKQFLQIMVEAAKSSLKQNSMPLPPWRSFAYLAAKWETTCQREVGLYDKSENKSDSSTCFSSHKSCNHLLKRLKSSIQSEIRAKGLFVPRKNDSKMRVRTEGLWVP